MNARILGGLCVVVLIAGCGTSYSVYDVKSNPKTVAKLDGVTYALPRTVMVVDVPITQTAFKPGQFARFSEALIGVKAKTAPSLTYAVGLPVISQRGEPDPTNTFTIKLKGNPLQTRLMVAELTDKGLLTHANAEVESKAVDFMVAMAQAGASIAGRFVNPGGAALAQGATLTPEVAEAKLDDAKLRELVAKLNEYRCFPIQAANLDNLLKELENVYGTDALKKPKEKRTKYCTAPSSSASDPWIFIPLEDFQALTGLLNQAQVPDAKFATLSGDLDPSNNKIKKDIYLVFHGTIGEFAKALKVGEKTTQKVFRFNDFSSLYIGGTPKNKLSDLEDHPFNADSGCVHIDPAHTLKIFDVFERPLAIVAAADLRSIQEKKIEAVFGGQSNIAGFDELSYKAMVEQLEKEIDRFGRVFTGTETTVQWTARFEWVPEAYDLTLKTLPKGDISLFDFSPSEGIYHPTDNKNYARLVSGYNDKMQTFLNPHPLLKPKATAKLVASFTPADTVAHTIKGIADREGRRGFYYRIPAPALGQVVLEDVKPTTAGSGWTPTTQRLTTAAAPVSQWGVVRTLPRSSGSWKKSAIDMSLYEGSGAIQKVTVSGDALDPKIVGDLGGVATSLQDAKIAAKKAELEAAAAQAAAKDEIVVLTRERDILQLQSEIEALKAGVVEEGPGPSNE